MKYVPMLCKLGTESDLTHEETIYEPKLDGYRVLCYVTEKGIKLITRNGNDITPDFPELDIRNHIKARTAILDGEIVIYNKKHNPDFNLLQNKKNNPRLKATLVVFDILSKNNQSLIKKELMTRKQILEQTIVDFARVEKIVYTIHGKELWNLMRKRKLEGVVAKKMHGHYLPGKRTDSWIKIKFHETFDAIIVGFTTEKRSISALALGAYYRKKLRYIGKVGTGFNEKTIKELYSLLKPLTTENPAPYNYEDAPAGITWIKPVHVAEIKYLEVTNDYKLRAPVFLHLRADKKPKDCTI